MILLSNRSILNVRKTLFLRLIDLYSFFSVTMSYLLNNHCFQLSKHFLITPYLYCFVYYPTLTFPSSSPNFKSLYAVNLKNTASFLQTVIILITLTCLPNSIRSLMASLPDNNYAHFTIYSLNEDCPTESNTSS